MIIEGPDGADPDRYPEFQYEDAAFTPPPDLVLESSPPIWEWSSPATVEGEVPVQTHSDTTPGSYEFTVSLSKADSDEDVTRRSTVTVK